MPGSLHALADSVLLELRPEVVRQGRARGPRRRLGAARRAERSRRRVRRRDPRQRLHDGPPADRPAPAQRRHGAARRWAARRPAQPAAARRRGRDGPRGRRPRAARAARGADRRDRLALDHDPRPGASRLPTSPTSGRWTGTQVPDPRRLGRQPAPDAATRRRDTGARDVPEADGLPHHPGRGRASRARVAGAPPPARCAAVAAGGADDRRRAAPRGDRSGAGSIDCRPTRFRRRGSGAPTTRCGRPDRARSRLRPGRATPRATSPRRRPRRSAGSRRRTTSASASVVDQFETEIRIAAIPCHVVPPSQHVPSAWTAAITRRVKSSISARPRRRRRRREPDEDLVEHDVVEDRHARRVAQAVGHPPGQRAAAVDQSPPARRGPAPAARRRR